MTFILNARYFLVTYPQCGTLDEWAVNDHFGSLGAECLVGRENHADGGTHLHIFCDFGRKFRSRRADIFDVGGHHPNIERSKRNPRKGAEYAGKDGDVVAGGLAVEHLPTSIVSIPQDAGSTLIACENRREFYEVAEDCCPWDLITKFGSFYAFAKWKWPELGMAYARPPGLELTDGDFPDLVAYRSSILELRAGRVKTLVIYGPPLTGKTTWAQSLGNHIYMRARYNAREASLCEGKDYCVIDDISGGIKYFPHWKDWFGGQPYVQIRLLYKDEVLLKWGKPTIWLNNRDPRDQLRDMIGRDYSDDQYQNDITWMDANCIFVYVDSPIVTFHANTE